MKTKLLVTIVSLAILNLAAMPVGAANYDADTSLTQLKADATRVDKLRHGYFTYNGNRMYYYW
jgi:hypothetical protein